MAILILLASLGVWSRTALGQIETDGTLDLAFDAGNFTNGDVAAAALQPDGKLLIAGLFSKVHGVTRHSIARLNTDGTLDLSFEADVREFGVSGMILQVDGKIIIFGVFKTVNGANRFAGIARLNSDGSLETSFNPGRGISLNGADDGQGNATDPGTVESVVLQADGKIVVTGQFFYIITGPGANVARSCVARFNSDGTFDPSYDPGIGFNYSLVPDITRTSHALRQSMGVNSGKIIVQGNFDTFDGHPVFGLVRLNTDGSFDGTFTPGTATDPFSVSGIFIQSNDQIVVFGYFNSFSGVACTGIVRLNNSGALDGGFTTAPFANYDVGPIIDAVAQQTNGKLIVGGFFHSLGGSVVNNVARLETNGVRDASFSATAGGSSGYYVRAVLVRPSDGKIFLGGYFSTYGGAPRNSIAWANGDGSVDNTFAGLAGVTDYGPQVYALATQADGKILAGGFFSSFNGTPHDNLVRLNPDSTIDPSFDSTLGTEGSVRAMLIQPNGKILIAGNVRGVNGIARSSIARLNSDGTLDTSFDPGAGANNTIYALALDASGDVYVGGGFTSFNGVPRLRVAKLSPTGALDPTFNQGGGGASGTVFAIASPDGAGGVVIAGSFGTYGGANARRIARLNTITGTLDAGFNAGGNGFDNSVFALLLAPDGKYYAGGLFNSFNGVARSRVARLSGNGSLDGTFFGPTMDGSVATLAIQNGKLFVGGGFATNVPGKILRLTSSGALDATFVTGTGIDILPTNTYPARLPAVSTLAIQADGKLLIGGIFNQYNGTTRICLARLTGPVISPTPTPTPGITPTPTLTPGVTPTPTPTFTPTPSATPVATPTPTGTPIATPTPTATPAPTGTPSATPGTLGNISTRLRVLSGDNALIGGMIATGTAGKRVIIRAIGPSLIPFGVPGALANPTLDLFQGSTLLFSNDDWSNSTQQPEIAASGLAPSNNAESAIIWTLTPGQTYTAAVRGMNGTTGIGVVEAFDLDTAAASKLGNISTRGFVDVDDNVMIAGLIAGPSNGTSLKILVRALGPTLSDFGVAGALANPTLDLVNASGTVIRSNDNWKDDPQQRAAIEAAGLAPNHDEEAALVETVAPGAYTAVVRGNNRATGVGLVEAYNIP